MTRMAQAWDRDNIVMVDVISVSGGRWLVRNQWTEDKYEARFTSLIAVWAEAEIVETLDEIVRAFDVQFAYHMLATLSENPEWAQVVVCQWANLY